VLTDFSAQFSGVTGADFSAIVCVREWVFGFVAYREHTQVLLGEEAHWFALPSWLTAVLFFAVALVEWLILRFFAKLLRRWWSRRRTQGAISSGARVP
jgi:protein-S-isoprenylcysteine O-methyltransferase Ste14